MSSSRRERVRLLAEQVRSGTYSVDVDRLARAMLEWRGQAGRHPAQGGESPADHRRSYMRAYMRRARQQQREEAA